MNKLSELSSTLSEAYAELEAVESEYARLKVRRRGILLDIRELIADYVNELQFSEASNGR